MPDVITGISFPQTNTSRPWYWYYPRLRPFYFIFLGGIWGDGWRRAQFFPIIKILPIDTQPLVPTFPIGFTSLEDAIKNGAPDNAFGRFRFTDDFFWKVIGRRKPPFDSIRGTPTARTTKGSTPISSQISSAVRDWRDRWNATAMSFNQVASTIGPATGDYSKPTTAFAIPLPTATSISGLTLELQQQRAYYGPVPILYQFDFSHFIKQAQAFPIAISQLNPENWDMSVYPPQALQGRTFNFSNSVGDYSGYSRDTNFPLTGPNIMG